MMTRTEPTPARGGRALKVAIHVARERAGLTSDMQVSQAAGISYDTLMNWFGDKTTPRPAEVRKVADALGTSFTGLMAAYEGRDAEPQPLQDAIRELVDEMRLTRATQDASTLALLRAVTQLVQRLDAVSGPSTSGRRVTG